MDERGKLKFSSAALPESYMRNVLNSGENYENFYEKTKMLDDIDEKSLIDKLKEAQDEIDYADYKQTMERSLEDSDYSDEESAGDDPLSDFTLRGVLFPNKAEKLVDEGERFDCFSCESPDCGFPHIR